MANPKSVIGRETDNTNYKVAGGNLLLDERKKIVNIEPGHAAYTYAFHLDAEYIIHTVGPAWIDGSHGERVILHSEHQRGGMGSGAECGESDDA